MQSALRWFLVCLFLSLCFFPHGVSAQNLDIWCVSSGDDGFGTGTVIRGPNGTVVLFDEGGDEMDESKWAVACNALLDSIGIANIDHAIASHYHADHIDGLDDLVAIPTPISIATCWDRGGTLTYNTAKDDPINPYYIEAVAGKRTPVTVDGSTDIDLGNGAMLYFLSVGAPDPDDEGNLDNRTFIRGGGEVEPGDENSKSITALITYGGFDFYVGGDAEGVVEKVVDDVVVDDLGRGVDVLHVDHHGSVTNETSSVEFLTKMDPEVCITSVWNNYYGHPTEYVMDRVDAVIEAGLKSNIRLSPTFSLFAHFGVE